MSDNWDAPLTYGEWLQQGDPYRPLRHLHALSNTPFCLPVKSREIRREKTRQYRRKAWKRQPEGGRYAR